MDMQVFTMRLLRIISIILFSYLSVVAVYYITQRSYLFHPSNLRAMPESIGLKDFTEMTFHTRDGESLVAWYAPPDFGKPTIFYLHGNAGALVHRAARLRLYRAQSYGVFVQAYRGFSGSTGAPNEAAIVADALMAYDKLKSLTPPWNKIVIYGESLGTAVAVQVAAMRRPAGVILESPFSSAADVGAYLYPFLPVHWLMEDRFESINYISNVEAPVLMLQGGRDRIVPAYFGQKLFDAIKVPKQAYFAPDATHYTLYEHGAFERIREFLDRFSTRDEFAPGTMAVLCRGCAQRR
jgi:fermentation-respiration switch protein FrsA (DUF1100 family)